MQLIAVAFGQLQPQLQFAPVAVGRSCSWPQLQLAAVTVGLSCRWPQLQLLRQPRLRPARAAHIGPSFHIGGPFVFGMHTGAIRKGLRLGGPGADLFWLRGQITAPCAINLLTRGAWWPFRPRAVHHWKVLEAACLFVEFVQMAPSTMALLGLGLCCRRTDSYLNLPRLLDLHC